jgi:hypothetical protein
LEETREKREKREKRAREKEHRETHTLTQIHSTHCALWQTRGNQRDLARAQNMKRQAEKGKGRDDDGKSQPPGPVLPSLVLSSLSFLFFSHLSHLSLGLTPLQRRERYVALASPLPPRAPFLPHSRGAKGQNSYH